ncbi:uncharacterized protein LOC129601873 isoform X4 [Paramacrobiotus metropolitanus]|uniref:uncharacterized protein LOC129601873 isoform X4 n=1 Tax=Paramacrobiotus metropolitanus TaxID=2943436 RepID=UPI0024461414|nr:uncharacterized protein LOC129601873 isoform X4 [Paramacrobiotus metropolitanus]
MLEVVPKELVFPEPAHTQAIVTLTVKNTGAKRTAYRIMTSAPHRFSVRPVFGLLKSHGIASILIQYRPADHSAICPDYKFRIKAAPVDNDQYSANDPSNFPSGRDHAPDTFHQNYRRALEDIVLLREENVRLREDLHRVRRSLARLHIASGDPVFNAFRNILPGSATAVIFFPYTLWQQLVTWFTSLRLGAFTVLVLFFCAGILTGSVLYK